MMIAQDQSLIMVDAGQLDKPGMHAGTARKTFDAVGAMAQSGGGGFEGLGCVQVMQRVASGLGELLSEDDEEVAHLVRRARAVAGAPPPPPHPDPTL